MAFWIVYQGNSWRRARAGGYLWAPKQREGGRTQVYWTNMELVRPGDLIFSGVDNAVRAISAPSGSAYSADRPDPRDADHWNEDGWRLDVAYTDLVTPLFYADWVPAVLNEMPLRHSGFTSTGRPNQGYLYHLPNSVGEYLLALARADGLDLAEAAFEAAPQFSDGPTEREAIARARIGQGKFRADLMARWSSKCAVTGLSRPELLRASHIKPWSSSNNHERLDPSNGLLLAIAYDAAFDSTLITFDDEGCLLLANDFSPLEAKLAGIDTNAKIVDLNTDACGYLAEHRELVKARVARWTCNGLVPITCLSLRPLSFESQGAYAAQI